MLPATHWSTWVCSSILLNNSQHLKYRNENACCTIWCDIVTTQLKEQPDTGICIYTQYIHTFHYITLHHITLNYVTSHYITVHYSTVNHITLQQYNTLHYIILLLLHTYTYILHRCSRTLEQNYDELNLLMPHSWNCAVCAWTYQPEHSNPPFLKAHNKWKSWILMDSLC